MSSRPQRYTLNDVEVLSTRQLHDGFYQMEAWTVRHATYQGEPMTIERELMCRMDAAVILLYDPVRDETVLVEQYRVGAHKAPTPWLIECVAGLIDTDEQPEAVARREAMEEAGVTPGRIEPICEYLPSPGGSNEKIHLYVGEVDASTAGGVHGLDHEGEDILVHRVALDTALDWLADGHINNAASIIGLQWLAMNREHLRKRWRSE